MSALQSQWIPVFRAGDYGPKGKYTAADLDQIVAESKPNEIPLVVGHPAVDSPALGWVKQFRRNGDELEMLPDQIDPEFEESVKAGRYKKRSLALVRGDNGKLRVRHVGWLGAMQPEVKGLQDARFNAESFEAIDFAEEDTSVADETKLTFSEWLGKLLGRNGAAAEPTSSSDAQGLVDKAVAAVKAEFTQQIEAQRAETKRVETQFSDFRKSVESTGATARVKALIAGLKSAKRWLPAYNKMGVPEMFNALASGATAEIQFGEGDKAQKLDAVQLFHDILDGLGRIVPEGTLVKFEGGASKLPEMREGVDPESVLFHQAVEKRAGEKKITYNEAYKELKREGYKPQQPGASAAGAV